MIGPTDIISQIAQDKPLAPALIAVILVIGLMVLIIMGLIITFFRVWMKAWTGGAPISFGLLIGMRLRKVPAERLVDAMIILHKAGFHDATYDKLELHHVAGGDVMQVARALAAARVANMPFAFGHAAAIDLDGRDVVAEVEQVTREAHA